MASQPRKVFRPEELAAVPVGEVAQIAARFTSEGATPAEAVRRAYELLEIALEARVALQTGKTYAEGIAHFEYLDHAYRTLDLPEDISPRDEQGKRLPVPFDQVMANLMPRLRTADRMPLFRRWLEFSKKLSPIEAGEHIARYREGGIPPMLYMTARTSFDRWRKADIAHNRALIGATGGVAKAKKRKR